MAESSPRPRLEEVSFFFLWLFAGVTVLSIALQNSYFVALAVAALAAIISGRWNTLRPASIWPWVLPFLSLALGASLLSENQGHSLETWRKWLLIVALLWTPALANTERRLRSLLGALLFFSALWAVGASVLALLGPGKAWWGGETFSSIAGRWAETGEWRAISGSGGYMVLGTASMLLLTFFTALAIEDANWRKPLHLLCLAALSVGLLLTQTRGAWIGAAIALTLLILVRQARWLWVLAALALALLAWPQSPVRERLVQATDMSRDSTRERVYMAEAGLNIIRAHPWLGVGDAMESWEGPTGHQAGYYRRYLPEAAKVWDTTRDQEQGHLHNNLIQVAAMYGLPALMALMILFGRLIVLAWKQQKSLNALQRGLAWGVLAVCVAWWINGMVEYNFGSFQSSFTLWFLLGLGMSRATEEKA